MAFDWTKVEGYREDMTPEEKIALLSSYEEPVPDKGGTNWKAQFDKASSELAAMKKQFKEKMSEDERKELERAENEKKMSDELAELKRERTVNQYTQSFMAQKYDAETAAAMAKAIADGDMDGMFEALKKGNDGMEQAIKTELLRNTPKPGGGEPDADKPSDGERLAKEIGGQRAAANKASNDILAHYK